MLESGEFDIDPSTLRNVVALASGDSIFIDSALLCDPVTAKFTPRIERVLGNLGRSELAFMVPTAMPMLKAADPGLWHVVNHYTFDGHFLDAFAGTSLHLSFTDYELPIDVGNRGLRDKQAVILESVVSLNNRGKMMGDIDVVMALDLLSGPASVDGKHGNPLIEEGFSFDQYLDQDSQGSFHPDIENFTESNSHDQLVADIAGKSCSHHTRSVANELTKRPEKVIEAHDGVFKSLDCWEEILDPPAIGCGTVRAAGNWEARLAALAVCRHLGKRILVLPPDACMRCLEEHKCSYSRYDIIIA
ncbi:hypothetical protein GGR57DRAFT_466603 [Xylariaceae sp. FL1272]|nr:hypothetical protein GGR57DRAFT_466603 [Xylariaceae sp. FL1272]